MMDVNAEERIATWKILSDAVEPMTAEAVAEKLGMEESEVESLLALLWFEGSVVKSMRQVVCHDCGHGRDAALVYSMNPYRCAECGEYWPCSDSRRRDLAPPILALHRARKVER